MIVRTLLDTDLYKFTTSYAYIKLFPYAMGKFSFHDRNETEYTEEFLERLKNEIDKLSRLRLTEEELEYMTRNCRFLPRVYWEWLSSFRFHPDKIKMYLDEAHHLHIEVSDFLYKATLYEVPLLAIVSERMSMTVIWALPYPILILPVSSSAISAANRRNCLTVSAAIPATNSGL